MAKVKKQLKTFEIKENKFVVFGVLAVFLTLVFLASSYKVSGDDDFFWHLATGRFVVENKYVPDKDVFGYASSNDEWIPFEWGWDVITYSLYNIGGYNAILIFRSVIFCAVFFILFLLMQKFKVNSFITMLVLFGLLVGIIDRLSPRPHVLTYLFFAALLYILLSFKYHEREKFFKWLYAIPVIFLAWGNVHMGVLAGGLILFIFTVCEIIIYYSADYFKKNGIVPLTQPMLKRLVIISVISALVLLLNPHGISTYVYAYGHTKMKLLENVNEWKNPFDSGMDFGFVVMIYKIFIYLGAVAVLYGLVKKDIFFIFIYAGFLIYSIRAIRFTVDYEIIIAVFLAVSLNFYFNKFLEYFKEKAASILKVTAVAASVFFIFLISEVPNNKIYNRLEYYRIFGWGINEDYLAVQLFDFMKSNDIKGKPFNHFGTGGMLVWYFPDQKNFIDSRNLNDRIFNEYQAILGMRPGFEKKLDDYGVDYILYLDPDLIRRPNELKRIVTAYATRNENWKLVFWDDKSMLFLRNIPKYADLISKYEYKVFKPYNALFFGKEFEQSIINDPGAAKNEIKRKTDTEPNGYLFTGMRELALKYIK